MSFYSKLTTEITSLVEGERNYVANCANVASVIYNELNKSAKDGQVNWAGFYFVDKSASFPRPFMGEPACIRIKIGKGVCGTVAKSKEALVVRDVHEFPGHIACDSRSNSEVVVPIVHPDSNELIGVLDLDSLVVNGFDDNDKENLSIIASIVASACDWTHVLG